MKFKNQNWAKLALELFVVFLGVTSGFLLNNWQVKNQEEKLEQKYLDGFSEDVKNNISELESAIKTDSLWIARANILIKNIIDGDLTLDSANVMMKLIAELNTIETNGGTYENIINSGNLNLITSYKLKSHIIKYQNVIAKSALLDDYMKNYFNNFILPFLISNRNLFTNEFTDPESFKSPRFSNIFGVYFSFMNQRLDVYKEFLNESYLLKNELDSNDNS